MSRPRPVWNSGDGPGSRATIRALELDRSRGAVEQRHTEQLEPRREAPGHQVLDGRFVRPRFFRVMPVNT
jgi:hypothetical protein